MPPPRSRWGNWWDNTPMETFFATLKKELVHDEDSNTHEEAKHSIFEYIETFYNRVRRHATPGYLSPSKHDEADTLNPLSDFRGELHG